MDVDGTMAVYPRNREFDRSPMELLEDLVMEKENLSREEALRRIRSCGDTAVHCLSEFLDELGIPAQRYFDALRASVADNLTVPADTVRLFDFLTENGFELYTATTNSPFMTWAKLSVAGLASPEGSPYITGCFPGCAFRDPRGKNDPLYYDKILGTGRFDPACCVMIGDVPEKDALPALRAGMRYGVNIDRTQPTPCFTRDGVLYINSFDVLIPMLEKAPSWAETSASDCRSGFARFDRPQRQVRNNTLANTVCDSGRATD